MWSDWLVFCDCGFSVSVFWCPLTTPTVLLGFLLTWTWVISSWLLQERAAAAPYLGQGLSPHGHPSWPWTRSSSSRPSCTRAPATPWTWGCSSQPLPRPLAWTSSFRLLPLTLGQGVAPLGHDSARSIAAGAKEYIQAVYCHPAYLTYAQYTSWEMLDWMKLKQKSRLLG